MSGYKRLDMSWQKIRSEDDIRLLLDLDVDVLLAQHFEEGDEEGGELLAVNGLVTVDVEQVEEVLEVVSGRGLALDETDDRVDHFWELGLGGLCPGQTR